LVEVIALQCFGLVGFNGDHILLGRDRDLGRNKSGDGECDLIAVFASALDIVWGIVVAGATLGGLCQIKQAIESDGRTPEGRENVSERPPDGLTFCLTVLGSRGLVRRVAAG
jgi:hypothetical protein